MQDIWQSVVKGLTSRTFWFSIALTALYVTGHITDVIYKNAILGVLAGTQGPKLADLLPGLIDLVQTLKQPVVVASKEGNLISSADMPKPDPRLTPKVGA